MYTYHYAVVRTSVPEVRLENRDISTVAVGQLLTDYSEVYLVISHPLLEGRQTLMMTDVRDLLSGEHSNHTVLQWLDEIDNLTLPLHKGEPEIESSVALTKDVWQAGYTADLCVPAGSPLNDALDVDKTDIWLRREDTDYVDLQRHCLATVNGYIHRLDADHQGAYIKDGGITFRRSQVANLGLISFKNVGRIHTYDITPEMVYNLDPARRYSTGFYLKLPFDTAGKVVGIVIGGYLHLDKQDALVTGPNTLKVNMSRIPFLERYMQSRYDMDLTALERFHEVAPDNPTDYDLQGFYSNESILELLTLSQSFVVAIDVDYLNTEIISTTRTHLPGRFYFEGDEPHWPLRTELGKLPAYLKEHEHGVWVLRVDNNLKQHRLFNTADSQFWSKVDEKRISAQPETFHRGDLIKYSTGRVVIKERTD